MATLWILGEAKSGKSELAEAIFELLPGRKLYVGTLPPTPENVPTIQKHRARRPADWALVEVEDDLRPAVEWVERAKAEAGPGEEQGGGCRRGQSAKWRQEARTAAAAGQVAVLLDGWGVYAHARARRWLAEGGGYDEGAIAAFSQEVYDDYRRLAEAADFLVIVGHVAARHPTAEELRENPERALVRAATARCMAEAEEVIYHDRTDVTDRDTDFVRGMAERLKAAARAE